MLKISDKFEESIDFFLQENKDTHSRELQKNNYKYQELRENLHDFIDNLLKDKKNQHELEENFFEYYYQLIYIEGMYLYEQGFKDCYKIIQLLEKE